MGRMISLGEPSSEMEENWRFTLAAQKEMTGLLQPGADPGAIHAAYNRFLQSNGYQTEDSLFAYGQGYDFIERPSIQPGETMKISRGMCLAVHTSTVTVKRASYCSDSFLITAHGPERLHKTAREIIIA